MFGLGIPELLLILLVVIILFGHKRLGPILGELGSGMRAFREGLTSEKKDDAQNAEQNKNAEIK